MLTIGRIAKTFAVLPSQVRSMGTTYDIMIEDVMMAWEHNQKNPQDQNLYREEDLIDLVRKTK